MGGIFCLVERGVLSPDLHQAWQGLFDEVSITFDFALDIETSIRTRSAEYCSSRGECLDDAGIASRNRGVLTANAFEDSEDKKNCVTLFESVILRISDSIIVNALESD